MKTIFTSACLMLSASMTFSQNWVKLKDPNFAKAIKALLPSSINESLELDTSSAEVKTRTYLFINGQNIENIEGLHFFKSLQMLTANDNRIAYLSTVVWPSTLTDLSITDNELKFFPQNLPALVDRINVYGNQITSVPNGTSLPSSLVYLNFGGNPITVSPDLRSLTNMKALALMQTQILHLKNIPNTVEHLEFNDGNVRSIDRFPDSLKYVYGKNNHLEIIKEGGLPAKLIQADFDNNDLAHVPENHSPRLQLLRLDYNQLEDFVLENTEDIQYVTCNYNKIKELQALPKNVNSFYINHNELTSLPETIPGNRLKFMECTYNYIHKIPDVYFGRGYTSFIGNYNCITEPRIFDDWLLTIGKFGYVEKPDRPDCDLVTKHIDETHVDISTYPNPVKEQVAFNTSNKDLQEVKILNDHGVALITINNYEDGSNIDLSPIPQGLYVAILKHGDKSIVKKIVKE